MARKTFYNLANSLKLEKKKEIRKRRESHVLALAVIQHLKEKSFNIDSIFILFFHPVRK